MQINGNTGRIVNTLGGYCKNAGNRAIDLLFYQFVNNDLHLTPPWMRFCRKSSLDVVGIEECKKNGASYGTAFGLAIDS